MAEHRAEQGASDPLRGGRGSAGRPGPWLAPLLAVMLVLVLPSPASSQDALAARQQLDHFSDNLVAITGDFRQEVFNTDGSCARNWRQRRPERRTASAGITTPRTNSWWWPTAAMSGCMMSI